MRDLRTLDKTLLKSEFDLARSIYESARNDGYSAIQAAAMCYRHGLKDGKDALRDSVNAAHKAKQLAQQELKALREKLNLPEVIADTFEVKAEEGSITNE